MDERRSGYKKAKGGLLDRQSLRVHRRSQEWSTTRADEANRRRNLEDLSPVNESDKSECNTTYRLCFSGITDSYPGKTPVKKVTKAEKAKIQDQLIKEKLRKYVEEKKFKKKIDAMSKAKKPAFKVFKVQSEQAPSMSSKEEQAPSMSAKEEQAKKDIPTEMKHDKFKTTKLEKHPVPTRTTRCTRQTNAVEQPKKIETGTRNASARSRLGSAGTDKKQTTPTTRVTRQSVKQVAPVNGVRKPESKVPPSRTRQKSGRSRTPVRQGKSLKHTTAVGRSASNSDNEFSLCFAKVSSQRGALESFAPPDFTFSAPLNISTICKPLSPSNAAGCLLPHEACSSPIERRCSTPKVTDAKIVKKKTPASVIRSIKEESSDEKGSDSDTAESQSSLCKSKEEAVEPMEVEIVCKSSEKMIREIAHITITEQETGTKDEEYNVPYYRELLKTEAIRLTSLSSNWTSITDATQDLSEDVSGQIRTTIGQAQLLMRQRFKQFSGLVDNCEFGTGDKETTCTDLQGFWEMIYFQVEDVDKKFADLEKLKTNNWVEEVEQPPAKKVTKKPPAKVKKPAAKSKFGNFRAKLQQQKKVTEDEKVFDGGFFAVSSPVKKPEFHCEAGTPSKSPKVTCKENPVIAKPVDILTNPRLLRTAPRRSYMPVVPSPLLKDGTPTTTSRRRRSTSLPSNSQSSPMRHAVNENGVAPGDADEMSNKENVAEKSPRKRLWETAGTDDVKKLQTNDEEFAKYFLPTVTCPVSPGRRTRSQNASSGALSTPSEPSPSGRSLRKRNKPSLLFTPPDTQGTVETKREVPTAQLISFTP